MQSRKSRPLGRSQSLAKLFSRRAGVRADFWPDLQLLLKIVFVDDANIPTCPDRAAELPQLAERHRVQGLLFSDPASPPAALERKIRLQLVGGEPRTEFRQSRADQAIIELLDHVDSLGDEFMVLKGWWTSKLLYARRAQHQFVDLDIWLAPHSKKTIGELAEMLDPHAKAHAAPIDVRGPR